MKAARLKADQRIAAERVELYDRIKADRLAADKARLVERQIEADKIAADRLKEDVELELEFAEADRRLDAERLEEDRRLVPLQNNGSSRKHRRTDQIDGRSELIADMKQVFVERFEEKHGGYLPINEVYDVFEKSTSLHTFEKNVFKHHCRKLFCAEWTHSRIVFKEDERCFTDMAVKRP